MVFLNQKRNEVAYHVALQNDPGVKRAKRQL